MEIKLYIVTYKGHNRLNNTLRTVGLGHPSLQVFIINNHSDIRLEPQFAKDVVVLENVLRPDFSTGHLSRNWNEAIINGFCNLNNPDCDIVCHCQDDTIFDPDWITKLVEIHKRYSFAQFGDGDHLCSYLPNAVKRIGLWDERFSAISLQAADYFVRAIIYNGEESTINDYHHDRLWNQYPRDFNMVGRPSREEVPQFTQHHLGMARAIFRHKWGNNPWSWNDELFHNLPEKPVGPSYVMYPYFEKDIEGLAEKGYIL